MNGNAGSTLEGVGLTLTYYAGSSVSGAGSSVAPTAVGIYTVVASFAGSQDYSSASSQATFTIRQASRLVITTSPQTLSTGQPSGLVTVQLQDAFGNPVQAGGGVAMNQWASSVIGFSSQYNSTNWSAAQALGAPDTNSYGDSATAWAPLSANGSQEYLELGYKTPVYATGVTIAETDQDIRLVRVVSRPCDPFCFDSHANQVL